MTARRSVLVTGGAGFIGSHLVNRLMQESFSVTVFDDFSTGTFANIKHHIGKAGFRLVRGDIRSAKKVQEIARNSVVVFHLAAVGNVQLSLRLPSSTNQVNAVGTLNLLEACRSTGIDLLVYASSSAVCGDAGKTGMREDMFPRPISPYAASKLAAESYCMAFQRSYGLPAVSLRLFNVYGPQQNSGLYAGVVSKFAQRLLSNKCPIIYGDGEQSRDFVNVKDIVDAFMLCLERKRAIGQVMNIGTGRSTKISSLASLLIRLAGKKHLKPVHQCIRGGEVRYSRANIDLAAKVLGYAPRISLERGLRQYLGWLCAAGK